eukprot:655969-Pleurochrysis_carterae.AAC.1
MQTQPQVTTDTAVSGIPSPLKSSSRPDFGFNGDGEDEHEGGQMSPWLRTVHAVCTRFNDGQPCRRPVHYTAPHYCEECLSGRMRGMRMGVARLTVDVRTTVEPWRNIAKQDRQRDPQEAYAHEAGALGAFSQVVARPNRTFQGAARQAVQPPAGR